MNDNLLTQLAKDPRPLLKSMQGPRGTVFRKSNMFRRDLQYGLWRYLDRNQTKVPYHDMETVTDRLVESWIANGIVRRIDSRSVELLLEEYQTPSPAAAADEQPHAAPQTSTESAAEVPDEQAGRDAKIAELQRRMAEARAKREQSAQKE